MQINPIWIKFCDHVLLFKSYNKKMHWVSIYLARKCELGTLFYISYRRRDRHLRGHPSHAKFSPLAVQRKYLHFSVILRPMSNGPAPRIEPATSRSAVKHSTDWANPAACVECIYCICASFLEDGRCVPKAFKRVGKLNRLNLPATIFINVL